MNVEKLSHWPIDLNQLIQDTGEKIQALKNNIDKDSINDGQQKEEIKSALSTLVTLADDINATVEQQHEIKQLQEEWENITIFQEGINKIKDDVLSRKIDQHISPLITKLDLDLYTVDKVFPWQGRVNAIANVSALENNWPISSKIAHFFQQTLGLKA